MLQVQLHHKASANALGGIVCIKIFQPFHLHQMPQVNVSMDSMTQVLSLSNQRNQPMQSFVAQRGGTREVFSMLS